MDADAGIPCRLSLTTTMSTVGQLQINKSEFTWKIENFNKLGSDVKDVFHSPTFKIHKGLNKYQWMLSLYPFGKDESARGCVSLFLHNLSNVNIDICFNIILSNVNGVILSNTKTHCNCFDPISMLGWLQLVKRDSLLQKKDSLVGDILNITLIIYMDMYSEKEVDIDKKILNNYESLFFNENFSDLTIAIKNNKLKVHKSILSARSKVFEAMFRHDMKENKTNTIKITDVTYNVMKEMLLFIYSGKVNDLNKNAKALLPAAEKYEIEELKVLCEKNIWKNVKIEDACDILIFADRYNCSELKAKIKDYIIINIKEINNTSKFKSLNRSNPELFEEVMSALIDKKC